MGCLCCGTAPRAFLWRALLAFLDALRNEPLRGQARDFRLRGGVYCLPAPHPLSPAMTDTSPDDEQVLLVVHKHWASLLGEAALTIVPGLTILSLLLLLRGLPITLADATVHAVITLLVPFCFLTLWTILAVQWTHYYLEMFVVTDRHIFYTTQVNFTERTVSQCNIHDVSHATVHVGGLVESFFNYGSLTIEGREENIPVTVGRSEERRVGKESRSRWS